VSRAGQIAAGFPRSVASIAAGEFGHPGCGVLRDSLEDIDEVGVGIDAVQATGDDQTLDDAEVARIGISNARPVQGCPQPFCCA
jgi:hypothetical protein